jgi:hypothetical protein
MEPEWTPGTYRPVWLSTDNALETLTFFAKDAILVVDDFCPTGSQHDVQAMHRKADRLFRGQGNTAGRGRLSRDGTPWATRPPRGMLCCSVLERMYPEASRYEPD